MNAIEYLTDGTIGSVILTSEDDAFLDKVVEAMANRTVSNVSRWNVIRNSEDFSVGEGTTTYCDTQKVHVHFDGNLSDTAHELNSPTPNQYVHAFFVRQGTAKQ